MRLVLALARAVLWIGRYFVGRRRTPYVVPALDVIHSTTNGRLDRVLSRAVIAIEHRLSDPVRFPADESAIFREAVEPHVANLVRDGVTVFDSKLPAELISRMRKVVESTEQIVVEDGEVGRGFYPHGPKGAQFKLTAAETCAAEPVQEILADPFLAEVARRYFGAVPVVSMGNLWWNTARSSAAPDYLAQKFHWDNAGLQWVHVFFYLTDVDETAGPHVFVKGSHVPVPERAALVAKGTVRLEDADVEAAFPGKVTPICGPAGTVLMVDTWGLHKAGQPTAKDRLVLDVMFNNSLLGINSPQPRVPFGAVLEAAARVSPRTYAWLR